MSTIYNGVAFSSSFEKAGLVAFNELSGSLTNHRRNFSLLFVGQSMGHIEQFGKKIALITPKGDSKKQAKREITRAIRSADLPFYGKFKGNDLTCYPVEPDMVFNIHGELKKVKAATAEAATAEAATAEAATAETATAEAATAEAATAEAATAEAATAEAATAEPSLLAKSVVNRQREKIRNITADNEAMAKQVLTDNQKIEMLVKKVTDLTLDLSRTVSAKTEAINTASALCQAINANKISKKLEKSLAM